MYNSCIKNILEYNNSRCKGETEMIIKIRVENYAVYSDQVELSLEADMRNKKLAFNVFEYQNINILKSIGIYGANNVGKTWLLNAINSIKAIILNIPTIINSNIFSNNLISTLGVTFLHDDTIYAYDFKYNVKTREVVKEEFARVEKDKYGNEKSISLLVKDSINKIYYCVDKNFENALSMAANTSSIIYMLKLDNFPEVKKYADILINLANKIDVVYPNNIPLDKTIEILKNKNDIQTKVIEFIKNADVDLDGIKYIDEKEFAEKFKINSKEIPNEEVLDMKNKFIELMRITSYHKGKPVPSMLFDSTGTKKIVALASYIIDAIENGKILVIDEIESSLHFKLTRAIVAMFNNEINKSAQLIFNTHDISLMDCKKLMRKEQIWFADKDMNRAYLYSLADFTAEDGVRADTSDIVGKYKKGEFGALPDPDLIKVMLEDEQNE